MKPVEWLFGLGNVIENGRASVGGKSAGLDEALGAIGELLLQLRRRDATLWWVGNGGSAALCSHLSQDALNKLAVRSLALSDASLLTCMANDFGYGEVFSRPLRTLARPGDMLIAVSSSGKSDSILNCVDLATELGMTLVTLSAFEPDNPLWCRECDVALYLPTCLYGHAEVGHEALLHAAIETLMLREQGGAARLD